MQLHFHVLASGSSGNASVLEVGDFCLLIDFGMSPRLLTPRLRKAGLDWARIDAVILTHTHSDHWKASTLTQLAKLRIPLYCHVDHAAAIDAGRRSFAALSAAGLIRHYQPGERLALHPACACVPIALEHDDPMTCGFRLEGTSRGRHWALGYAADLGSWQRDLLKHLADVDLLALEFNHDVDMQLASGRSPYLIRRVLGDRGHLSNEQAADLLAAILQVSAPGRLAHLVQLHLSDDCNRPALAASAARRALKQSGAELTVHTTQRGRIGPSITLGAARQRHVQPLLPFAD